MRRAERLVERQGPLGCGLCWNHHLAGRLQAKDAKHSVRIRQSGPRQSVLRIFFDGAAEVLDASPQIVRRALVPKISGLEIGFSRLVPDFSSRR